MATSGDQEKGSTMSEETDHPCSPCETDGKQVNAVGYCVNCEEFLCQCCFDVHLKPSLMRNHELLDREHIPKGWFEDENRKITSRKCPQHDTEVINYHCPKHSFLGCHFCSHDHQKSCRDVLCIPNVSHNLTNTTEYKEFTEKLAGFTNTCMQTTTEFKANLQAIESSHAKTIADIQEFKRQLLDAVDKAETNLVDKANTIKEANVRKATELNDKCDAILKEHQRTTSMVGWLQRTDTDLYIAMVNTRETLKAVEEEIKSFANTSHTLRVSFKANNGILKEFNNPCVLGKLTKAGDIQSVEHELDINIKSGTDTNTCQPIGSVLCSDNLVITDENNESVKLVDIASNTLTSELKLSSMPLGVCKITDNEVAVAEKNKVVFIKTGPPLRIERDFAITSNFHGLAYHDNTLILSYNSPPKVEVLDMQGNVLKTFVNDAQGHTLFSKPFHVTVNPENKRIYVSNYSSHNVVCMKFDGTVVAKYTDSALQYPWQVITDSNGMVYVCGSSSHNIHQLTEDCKKVKVLLNKADGLLSPESISLDEIRGKLYVGETNRDILKVYNVK